MTKFHQPIRYFCYKSGSKAFCEKSYFAISFQSLLWWYSAVLESLRARRVKIHVTSFLVNKSMFDVFQPPALFGLLLFNLISYCYFTIILMMQI